MGLYILMSRISAGTVCVNTESIITLSPGTRSSILTSIVPTSRWTWTITPSLHFFDFVRAKLFLIFLELLWRKTLIHIFLKIVNSQTFAKFFDAKLMGNDWLGLLLNFFKKGLVCHFEQLCS